MFSKVPTFPSHPYANADSLKGLLTVTDATFVLFPIMFVWKLNMAMKRKVGLVIIFALGTL